MKRLRGGILQTCRQCVLGVTGKSEKQIIAVRYPFASWIKHREISFSGRKEGVLTVVALLLTTGAKEVFSTTAPPSAQNPGEEQMLL